MAKKRAVHAYALHNLNGLTSEWVLADRENFRIKYPAFHMQYEDSLLHMRVHGLAVNC